MEVEFPKPSTNLNSMIVNSNPIKYVYHSSSNQVPQQRMNEHLPQLNNGHSQMQVQSNHAVQPSYQPYSQGYTNSYSYTNQTNLNQVPVQREGYQFSQYHQKNSYTPSYNNYSVTNNNNYMYSGYNQQNHHHNDEQLL